MKTLFLGIGLLWAGSTFAQYTLIPDTKFEAKLISLGIDKDGANGKILTSSISNITSLDVSNLSITNLAGIEGFSAIKTLKCNRNQLSSLDVSKNTTLTYLDCFINQITSLDVSKNTALTYLKCNNNQITSLDVSKNAALIDLRCSSNQLTSLEVSQNTALTDLYCDYNQLTSLDVSKNTDLNYFYCSNNRLSSLDVSKNTALTWLNCSSNLLTSLDVSKNTALTYLDCSKNKLTSLDVNKNTTLTSLYCSSNLLTSLDVSKNTALTWLTCSNNKLTSLDVSKNTDLTYLNCSSNQLTSLEVSQNTALTDLYCDYNQLTSLDVSKNTDLTYFHCSNNRLSSLDVIKNTALTDLYCDNNQLTSLDVINNTAITYLGCSKNKLTSLDISKNTALTYLNCSSNPDLKMICVKSIAAVSTNSSFIKDSSASWSESCVFISAQSLNAQTACQASNMSPLSITVLGNGTFQWYSNTIASYTGGISLGEVATNASYTPSSNKSGTLYYYCIVKGSYGSINSNISGPITVLSNSTSTNVVSACNKYIWAGNTYSQSGIYTSSYKNTIGCDSIATLQLTIKKASDTTKLQEITICEGAGNEYDFYGQLLSKSGYYYKTFTNNLGCDSVIALPLVVKPITFTLPSAINYNAPAQLLNTTVSGGTFSGTGVVGNAYFNPKIAGMGVRKVTYTLNNGAYCKATLTQTTLVYDTVGVVCIKNDTVKVSVSDTLLINKNLVTSSNSVVNNSIKIYPNPAHNSISIDNGNFSLMDGYSIKIIDVLSNTLFSSNINQQLFTISLNQWSTGIYFVQIIDKNNNITDIKKLLVE